MEKEIWKDIPGYEGIYQASNLGRIRSLKYDKVRILKPGENGRGYCKVNLCLNKVVKSAKVHRLVWEAFNGSIPENYQINHLNEIKSDNRLENLSLCTAKENVNYGTRTERAAKHFRKPVLQLDKQGNFIKEWPSSCEIQRQLGYATSHILECCHNLRPSAHGFIWKHKENPKTL